MFVCASFTVYSLIFLLEFACRVLLFLITQLLGNVVLQAGLFYSKNNSQPELRILVLTDSRAKLG